MCCSAATPPWHLTRPAMAMDVSVGGRTNDETTRRYRTKAQLESQVIDRREFHDRRESQARKDVDRRRDTEYGSVIQHSMYKGLWRERVCRSLPIPFCSARISSLTCVFVSDFYSRCQRPQYKPTIRSIVSSYLALSLNQHITPLDDGKGRAILCLGPLLHAGILIPAGDRSAAASM